MRLIRCPTGHGNVLLNRTFAARLSRAVNVLARTACKSDTSSAANPKAIGLDRSEEHTSELQSQSKLVCRLLLEKKNSIKTWKEDSVWQLDAAKHNRDLQNCRRGKDPLDACLLVAGWPVDRVTATADSLWHAEAPQHRRELEACQRKREMNLSSCLTLYYKWDSDRALQTADSVTRVRLGGVPQQRRR